MRMTCRAFPLRRLLAVIAVLLPILSNAFVAPSHRQSLSKQSPCRRMNPVFVKPKGQNNLINKKRREQLGINDDEDEYDLYFALDQNTDPLITKVIAGSFIVVIIGLLVAGIIVPSLTDYGEGVCNPLLTSGRC